MQSVLHFSERYLFLRGVQANVGFKQAPTMYRPDNNRHSPTPLSFQVDRCFINAQSFGNPTSQYDRL
jgi:hypothetical protein